MPAAEEFAQGMALAESELQRKQAVGAERGVRLRDKAAVDFEAVGSGEERGGWFVVADFEGERGRVGEWDVGWVGDEDVEGLGCWDFVEQVGLHEGDAVGEVVVRGVGAGNFECGEGDVAGCDLGVGKVRGECECDGSGSGTDIEYANLCWLRAGEVEDGFDEEFGLGAWDECVAGDAEC